MQENQKWLYHLRCGHLNFHPDHKSIYMYIIHVRGEPHSWWVQPRVNMLSRLYVDCMMPCQSAWVFAVEIILLYTHNTILRYCKHRWQTAPLHLQEFVVKASTLQIKSSYAMAGLFAVLSCQYSQLCAKSLVQLLVRHVTMKTSPVTKFSVSADIYARLYNRYQLLTMAAMGSCDSKQ